jgi:hypothetical protein
MDIEKRVESLEEKSDNLDKKVFEFMKTGILTFSDNVSMEILEKLLKKANKLEDYEAAIILQNEIELREYFNK